MDCQDAYQYDGYGRADLEEGRTDVEEQQKPIDHSASGAGQGIDVLAENQGHLVDEHVAEYTSCSACHTSHYYVYPHGIPGYETLFEADYGEEAQTYGVEDEEGVLKTHYPFLEYYDDDEGEQGDEHIRRLHHPEWLHIQQNVPEGTSADCCHESDDEGAEEVKVLAGSQTDAAYRESEGSYVVEYVQQLDVLKH